MTIESELKRIADALEKIAAAQASALTEMQREYAPAQASAPAPAPATMAPVVTPTSVSPGPPQPPSPTLPGAPPSSPPGAPSLAPAPGAPMPGAAAPAPGPTPVQGVPTLDDIRASFNDFARAHPDQVQNALAIVNKHGAAKLDELQPATYPQVMQDLKALGG